MVLIGLPRPSFYNELLEKRGWERIRESRLARLKMINTLFDKGTSCCNFHLEISHEVYAVKGLIALIGGELIVGGNSILFFFYVASYNFRCLVIFFVPFSFFPLVLFFFFSFSFIFFDSWTIFSKREF